MSSRIINPIESLTEHSNSLTRQRLAPVEPEPEITARPSERPSAGPDDYEGGAPEDLGRDWLGIATEAPARLSVSDPLENLMLESEANQALLGEHSARASGVARELDEPAIDIQ